MLIDPLTLSPTRRREEAEYVRGLERLGRVSILCCLLDDQVALALIEALTLTLTLTLILTLTLTLILILTLILTLIL